jgi:hypothetical protein
VPLDCADVTLLNGNRYIAHRAGGVVENDLLPCRRLHPEQVAGLLVMVVVAPMIPMRSGPVILIGGSLKSGWSSQTPLLFGA